MMNETEILNGVRRKERSAQTALFNLYKTHWYMICLRYNRDQDEAKDALQNGLIKIYSQIAKFDPAKGNFKSWSSKILVNENLMLIRKRREIFSIDQIAESDYLTEQEEEAETERLSSEELTQLIQKLPDGYRVVFNMYVMEGYTHNEIASTLNISVGTSKSQLFKAKKLLQQQLEVLI